VEDRKFGPKSETHPSVGQVCPVCKQPFKVGDYTTLFGAYPASPEDAEKKARGAAYIAEACEVHWDCAH
jgi:hypothetical protein